MKNGFEDFKKELEEWVRELPEELADEAVDYFKENIEEARDVDGDPFQEREPDFRPGGAILQQRGSLRDSIRVLRISTGEVVLAAGDSAVDYAGIHNEGGEIGVTDKMKKFFWAMFYEAGGEEGGEAAELWKAMALKKVGSKIKIPQRQFIGESEELERRIEQIIENSLDSLF